MYKVSHWRHLQLCGDALARLKDADHLHGLVQERMEFDEPDFALIDTLFSLAEAHLFMQLIELQDNHPDRLPAGKSCADIYR